MKKLLLISTIAFVCLSLKVDTKPSINDVMTEIKSQDILHDTIVLQQAMWETGWMKRNNSCWRFNNLFGFRTKNHVREGNPKGYIEFDTWQESVAYYKRWQIKHYDGIKNYLDFLNCLYIQKGKCVSYAGSESYTSNIIRCDVGSRLETTD